ncbi:MAG: hypothetical protein SPD90_02920 [Intestinibacter sp.]|uniref:hypothetical protein n=1 Tax=Intestinibacter sp. TaxID=1965304 RepID=UPI002A7F8830|nr:hypothetical protein [Intestinibacter sp.]MDY4573990.1 hypothetical protein [Intestinibacter sp.]
MLGIFSAVGSFISGVVSTVGSFIASSATRLVTRLPEVVLVARVVIDVIATVISKVAEVLGIAPKDENPEELGAKSMQEGTRPRSDFESTQEYLDYLRKDVKLDEEKYAKMCPEQKIACSVLGTTMVAKSIEEKTGVELPPEFLETIYKSKLRHDQVERCINSFADNGISSMGEMTKYITNDLSEDEASKVGGVIKDSLKELSPSMTDAEIQQEIVAMKRSYNESQY